MSNLNSIFRKFPTQELAIQLKSDLAEVGITAEIVKNAPYIDVTFALNTLQDEYEVKIHPDDFAKAETLLTEQSDIKLDEVDADYYLLEFSNEELFEILLKPDEWSTFDHSLAQKILTSRGKIVDIDLIHSLKKERLDQLSKPEENQKPWIIGGYIFSILGGFLGIIIGYFLWTAKKTLPNGQKVYTHSDEDRKHGKYIFYIGLVIFPIGLILRLIYLN